MTKLLGTKGLGKSLLDNGNVQVSEKGRLASVSQYGNRENEIKTRRKPDLSL